MAYEPCPNCNGPISCSCQYLTAKDGTTCCDACVKNYNLAMDIASAVVETLPSKKTIENHESTELPIGDADSSDDEQPEVL